MGKHVEELYLLGKLLPTLWLDGWLGLYTTSPM